MRLKSVGLALLTLLAAGVCFAENFAGPAGRFIPVGGSINLLGDVNTSGKANGNCLEWNASTSKWQPATCSGGSGAASVAIDAGGVQVSSPTSVVNFSTNVFTATESPTGTANLSVNFSSITAQGNVFNTGNGLVQLSGGLIPNSLIDTSSVTKLGPSIQLGSETTGNYLAGFTAGAGISVGTTGPGATPSVTLTPGTLTGNQTWGNNTDSSLVWTWGLLSGSPSFTFGNASITSNSTLQAPTVISPEVDASDVNADVVTTSDLLINGDRVIISTNVLQQTTFYSLLGIVKNFQITGLPGAGPLYADASGGISTTTISGGSGGGFWIGTATSPLNMQGLYAVYGATMVITSSFSVTGATEAHNSLVYIAPSSTTMTGNQKLMVYTPTGGQAVESFSDIVTDGMELVSTDTKSGALVMQSSFTIPATTSSAGTPASAGQIALKTTGISSSMGTIQLYDGTQLDNVVVTTNTPSDGYAPVYDSASGKSRWAPVAASGGSGTPGGSNTQVQFNDGSAFAGITEMTFSTTTRTVAFSSAVTHTNVSSETFTNANVVLSGTSKLYDNTGSAGTSGYVWTSNGSSSGPTWQASGGGTGGNSIYPATATASFPYGYSASTAVFTSAFGTSGNAITIKNTSAYDANNKMSLTFQQNQDDGNMVDAGGLTVGWQTVGAAQYGDVRLNSGVDNGSGGTTNAPFFRIWKNGTNRDIDFGSSNAIDGGGVTSTNPILRSIGTSGPVELTNTSGKLVAASVGTGTLPSDVMASSVTAGAVGTAQLADNAVTAAKINTSAVGSGLGGGNGTALTAVGDETTIHINGVTGKIEVLTTGAVLSTTTAAATYQPLDSDLTALANNSTNGMWARTGTGTGSARTLTSGTTQLIWTNGDGVSGAPSITVSTNVVLVGGDSKIGPYDASRLVAIDAGNIASGNLSVNRLDSGTSADSSHYWRGDGSWATVTAAGDNLGSHIATQPVSMAGYGITNLGVTSSTNTLSFAGGTVSGTVDMSTNPATNLQYIQWADSGAGFRTYASSTVYLASDSTIGTSTWTIPGVAWTLSANSTYTITGTLVIASPSSNASGFKLTCAGPTAVSFRLACLGGTTAASTGNFAMTTTTLGTLTGTAMAAATSQTWFIPFVIEIVTGAGGGIFNLQAVNMGGGTYTFRQMVTQATATKSS